MATHTAQKAQHATLTGGAADTVTLSGCHQGILRIRNRATSGAPIYFRVYPESAPSKPAAVAEADENYVVPFADLCDLAWSGSVVVVSLISADSQAYSVESIPGLQ